MVGSTTLAEQIDVMAAFDAGGVSAVYQSIAELATRRTVGYEALARLPARPGASGLDLLEAAREVGRLDEVEWACRLSAVRGALDGGLDSSQVLFVNVEPGSIGAVPPPSAHALGAEVVGRFNVVVEFTERELLRNPSQLLRHIAMLRELGMAIALDDVGANVDSLALLDFVRPDVIKLDLSLIQQTPERTRARTLMAVMAYCETSPVHLLAEGIENEQHLEQALAVGADLGQGWYFGRPGPLPVGHSGASLTLTAVPVDVARTPFDLVRTTDRPADPDVDTRASRGNVRVARQPLLYALTRDIERQAQNPADPPVVLAAFQEQRFFIGQEVEEVYRNLAARSPLVAVFGHGFGSEPTEGVRGVALTPEDPLALEWTLVVLGAHYSAAVIAQEVGPHFTDPRERSYRFMLTHDRDTVAAAGRSLLSRMTDPYRNNLSRGVMSPA